MAARSSAEHIFNAENTFPSHLRDNFQINQNGLRVGFTPRDTFQNKNRLVLEQNIKIQDRGLKIAFLKAASTKARCDNDKLRRHPAVPATRRVPLPFVRMPNTAAEELPEINTLFCVSFMLFFSFAIAV